MCRWSGRLDAREFVDADCGLPTVEDILAELAKPGRDPRSEFKVAQFADGVNDLEDLKPGMILEGVITNVTKFGAFVDLGVHQDGLIHISELANEYVRTPSDVVAVGRPGSREGARRRSATGGALPFSRKQARSGDSHPNNTLVPDRRRFPQGRFRKNPIPLTTNHHSRTWEGR